MNAGTGVRPSRDVLVQAVIPKQTNQPFRVCVALSVSKVKHRDQQFVDSNFITFSILLATVIRYPLTVTDI